ncbi:pyrroloquinoline quinone biosynthesis protein PqqF [Stutzerimonas urumqiensis]|uniref:pyrroloquinoline quinone biosynthesis protein PqqF n=1 Tax=Stutzerimonas urumqiensis TaxID=638269 RepID=UPI000EB5AE00|nr:pyrroloquinoline quinone biosynthesis protein PqqF [Stutzerimonas urumqiensis]
MSHFSSVSRPQPLILSPGVCLRFVALPPGNRAAALVRVHAGLHDAPVAYPGLAHFLEHLLFLGSEGFGPDEGLMPFVQRCGGQLNATTRARHTDYFFEVPSEALPGALARLCDMLAQPLLDIEAQHREREVVHAEFLARAQDADTLIEAALGALLAGDHPFGGFHAGHRGTLSVESPAFQDGLRAFHQCHYRSGQLELWVAAPEPPRPGDPWLERAQGLFGDGAIRQRPPALPALDGRQFGLQLPDGAPQLLQVFALDRLPDGSSAALGVLGELLASQAAHSLHQVLVTQGWCERVSLRVAYFHADQAVVAIELTLTAAGLAARGEVAEAVRSWLLFVVHAPALDGWLDEQRRVMGRRLIGLSPLARLRHEVEPHAWMALDAPRALHDCLVAVLDRMNRQTPALLICDAHPRPPMPRAGFPLAMTCEPLQTTPLRRWQWRLPAANPWLCDRPRRPMPDAPPSPALRALPDEAGEPMLLLRWRFGGLPDARVAGRARRLVARHAWAAQQAGVALRLDTLPTEWRLTLSGCAEPIPAILLDLAPLFVSLEAAEDEPAAESGPGGLAIRQLLEYLPTALDLPTEQAQARPVPAGRLWERARWDALALGLDAGTAGMLAEAMTGLGTPTPVGQSFDGATPAGWHRFGPATGDAALLLFYPLPAPTPLIEASWRLLARHYESPFYRRLRSELQLGYAVFCGFRLVGGHAGLLFGVQSPTASADEVLTHIEAFLGDRYALLRRAMPAPGELAADVRAALDSATSRASAHRQAFLAGLSTGYPQAVQQALGEVDATLLLEQAQRLAHPSTPRVVLCNQAPSHCA